MLHPRSGPIIPFHILNFGKSGPFHILNFRKSGSFHILNLVNRTLSHTFPWKGTPFTYLSLKRNPFHIPFSESVPLSHTSSLKKGPLSHTWSPKRYPFWAEHPHIVHYREPPFWKLTSTKRSCDLN